jgi:tetratricopeptide (TPR) repeat protein
MTPLQTALPPKYNPAFMEDNDLTRLFVVRRKYVDLILETVRDNNGPSNQHILVVGPRGIGKTTLIRKVAAEIRQVPDLRDLWLPVVFAEEAYEISTPGEFWLEALRRLADQVGTESLKRASLEIKTESDEARLRERALGRLLQFARDSNKRLLLIIENLNMLLGEQLDDAAAWELRHTLLNEPRIMLLATALSRFKQIDNVGKAWFELFTIYILEPLTPLECNELFEAFTGRALPSGQARAVQILTGGNPRLVRVLAQFSNKRSFRDLLSNLIHLIDEHTEYFKSQIDSLAPTERKVFVALLDIWQPATAQEIAKSARLTASQASALLGRLVSRGAVSVVRSQKKKKLYQASERLYNIYYLLRRHGHPSMRVRAAVRFMTHFYHGSQLIRSTAEIAKEACTLESPSRNDHFAAYGEILNDPLGAQFRDEIIRATPKEFFSFPDSPSEIRQLAEIGDHVHDHDTSEVGRKISKLLADGQEAQVKGELHKAEALFREAIALRPNDGHALAHLGFLLYGDLHNFNEAKDVLEKATVVEPSDAWIWMHKGWLASEMEDYELAAHALKRSVELNPKQPASWQQLAYVCHQLGEYAESETACRKVIELGNKRTVALSWARLAELLDNHLDRKDEAEQAYEKAISFAEPDGSLWMSYAGLIRAKGRLAEADEYWQRAQLYFEERSQLSPDDDFAWNRLGRLYSREAGKRGLAEHAYRRATELKPKNERYWHELAAFVVQDGRLQDAANVSRAAVEANPESWGLLATLGWVLEQLQDTANAEQAYQRSIGLNSHNSSAITALGKLKLRSGKTKEGIELLRQSTALEGWSSSAWPSLLTAEFDSNLISISELMEKVGRWLTENGRSALLLNNVAWQLAQTRRGEILAFAESLAREAVTDSPSWERIDTLCFILMLQQRWADALEWAPQLFDYASESGEAVEASIRFAVAAATSGYPQEVIERLKSSKARGALETLETGIRQFLGQEVVAPEEIAEVAHDIAERIRIHSAHENRC